MEQERVTVNPDLKRERERCSFDPLAITHALDGGIQTTYRRRYVENLALADRDYDGPHFDFMSREERFEDGLRKEFLFGKKVKELGLSPEEITIYQTAVFGVSDTGMGLHRLAFAPVILTQTTPEQLASWLPEMEAGRMVGCYAQTEMGHGSHVRGLETTATYDPATEEFIINTPTLTATKWWPGNLGKSSNYALVLAQLYTRGAHRGLLPFLVPIRSPQDHQPLPGIQVGDIGPKYSSDMNDNGWLRMDNVRIPRMNMLMRHAKVLADGTFVKPENEKLTYSGMLAIRALLPMGAARALAMATTIATRYSCVRRQSELRPGAGEPLIMEYMTQQHKLFPLIATAYAMWLTASSLKQLYTDIIKEINNGDFSRLIEIHGLSATLKAYSTSTAADGVEQCRLSCGGHGYSQASGLPVKFTTVSGGVTAEGEKTVMYLQAARYLMKCAANVQQGKKLDASTAYLARTDFGKFRYQGNEDLDNLNNALQYRAHRAIMAAALRLQRLIGDGKDMSDAWNGAGVLLVKAAQAHAEQVVMRCITAAASGAGVVPGVSSLFSLLAAIYAIYTITQRAGDFLQDGFMSTSQLDFLKDALLQLYKKLRPDAVGAVDAFDFRDQLLSSVLGRYDGDVYNKLYEWAQNSTLNKTQVHKSFGKYLKPLRESKL